jgi:hypothetical protein
VVSAEGPTQSAQGHALGFRGWGLISIVVRVLAWVACLPILLPSGLCLHQLSERGVVAFHQEQVQSQKPQANSCCCHHHAVDSDRLEADSTVASISPQGDHPAHPANCPTIIEYLIRAQADDFSMASVWLSLPLSVEVVEQLPLTNLIASEVVSSAWPESPPLYLMHCSLVI